MMFGDKKIITRTLPLFLRTLPLFLVALGLMVSVPRAAFADCTSPAGPAGRIDYTSSGTEQVFKYCNGTDWVPWAGEPVTGAPAPSAGFDLTDLGDVDTTGVSDGECITYNNGAGEWQATSCGGGGGTPAGTDRQIQFNSAGAFGADANFVYDVANQRLGIGTATPSSDMSIADSDGDGLSELRIGDGATPDEFQLYFKVATNNAYIRNEYNNTSTQGNLWFVTGQHDDDAPIMVMEAKGNAGVGIWDTTPDAYLEITEDLVTGTSDFLMISSAAANDGDLFIIDNSGLVGIGTDTPLEKLHVANGNLFLTSDTVDNDADYYSIYYTSEATHAGASLYLKARNTMASPQIVQDDDSLGYQTFLGYDGADFQMAGAMTVAVDGTPGVGDMPGRLEFHVAADGEVVDMDTDTPEMVIKSDGKIGIGTDTPNSTLHVLSGDIRLDGGAGNQAGCLRFNDSTDKMQYSDDCSSFSDLGGGGASAINDLTDAIATYGAVDNVFLGGSAGNATTLGLENVALGVSALESLDGTCGVANQCDRNTAVGHEAGQNTTTGYYNTFIGHQAGDKNTIGNSNTFVGKGSGTENTIGWSNAAVGTNSMNRNVSGPFNAAMGASALYSNTTGEKNAALGNLALYSSVHGDRNTAVGYAALRYSSVTGTVGNTAVGYQALLNTSTGVSNVALGPGAGTVTTTGSSNILIGNNANAPAAGTSNHLNIGDTIYGDLSNDTVGIGKVPAAGVELDVSGDINYTGVIVDVSDIRMKYDIAPLESPLTKLTALNGFAFKMKGDEDKTVEYGVSAQDVQKSFPELVHHVDDDGTLGVSYNGLIPPVIEAIKALKAENDALKAANVRLEARLDALEQQQSGAR
ncbi:MAG: tail fiber domain-containing protein [Candidatus Thiodiazotropha lotti]|nr:tail fiber domain-containing protein [Candidatus Thiodiazotropha lotti]